MRECERRARYLYLNDPIFHKVVECLEKLMKETKLSPNDVHDAVNLAADRNRVDNLYYKGD